MGCVSGTHSSFPEHVQLNELLFICSCLSSLHLLFSATPEWRNSRISIPIADRTHSGIYSCSLLNTTLTVVNVQVLNGEFYFIGQIFQVVVLVFNASSWTTHKYFLSALLPGEMPAAVQHNSSGRVPVTVLGQSPMPIIIVLLFYRFLLSAHICWIHTLSPKFSLYRTDRTHSPTSVL